MPSVEYHTSFCSLPVLPPTIHIAVVEAIYEGGVNTAEACLSRVPNCATLVASVQFTPAETEESELMTTSFPEVPSILKSPLILKVLSETNSKGFPAVVAVKLLKVMAGVPLPESVEVPVVSKNTVPDWARNVSLLVKFLPMVTA